MLCFMASLSAVRPMMPIFGFVVSPCRVVHFSDWQFHGPHDP